MAFRYLVLGSRGTLGSVFMRMLGPEARGLDLPELDVTDAAMLTRAIAENGPECVINCAALADVDECERHSGKAFAVHRDAVRVLASAAPKLVTFSTDQVFSGRRETPWLETDFPDPPNQYALSKLEGEKAALGRADSLVIRTSWLFGGKRGLVPFFETRLAGGGIVRAVVDQKACVTYAPDLANCVLRMTREDARGLFHIASPGGMTPYELAVYLSGGTGEGITPIRWADLGLPAKRPVYSVLGTLSRYVLPDWRDAIDRWRLGDD